MSDSDDLVVGPLELAASNDEDEFAVGGAPVAQPRQRLRRAGRAPKPFWAWLVAEGGDDPPPGTSNTQVVGVVRCCWALRAADDAEYPEPVRASHSAAEAVQDAIGFLDYDAQSCDFFQSRCLFPVRMPHTNFPLCGYGKHLAILYALLAEPSETST